MILELESFLTDIFGKIQRREQFLGSFNIAGDIKFPAMTLTKNCGP